MAYAIIYLLLGCLVGYRFAPKASGKRTNLKQAIDIEQWRIRFNTDMLPFIAQGLLPGEAAYIVAVQRIQNTKEILALEGLTTSMTPLEMIYNYSGHSNAISAGHIMRLPQSENQLNA